MGNFAPRRALFIDGANLYAAAKSLGFDIDYRKLRHFFEPGSWMLRAYYYTAISEDQDYSPIRPLADWLDYNNYTLISKPAKDYTDSMGRRHIRGNMDVEITVDALQLADKIDHMILISGNADFRRLIEAMQAKGVRVTVVSTIRTSPPMAADDVRRQADEFLDLLDIAPDIERRMPDHGGRMDRPEPRRPEFDDMRRDPRPAAPPPADGGNDEAMEDEDDINERQGRPQPLRGPGDYRDNNFVDDDDME
jgi:uncharacterized LabA/DUF88 family protein